MAKKSGKVARRKSKPATPKIKTAKSTANESNNQSRQRSSFKFKRLAREPRPVTPPPKLASVWVISRQALSAVNQRRRQFIGITLIYGLLNLVLVQGLTSGSDVASLKSQLSQALSGHLSGLVSSLSSFVVLVDSAGNSSSPTAGVYQTVLAIIASLAIIWALRQTLAKHGFSIRDAFYRSMSPLIPFILVLLVIGLQLLPLIITGYLYSLVIGNGIAVQAWEKIIWLAIFLAGLGWSLYMLSASVFALYIVTLPDMTPLKAIRSARKMVAYRRLRVLLKIVCLPVILLLLAAIIMTPIIIWLTSATSWLFFILTMFVLLAIHSYMYVLYRELLNE